MRPPTACLVCRNRRRRCVAGGPGEPCRFCKQRRTHCTLVLHAPSIAQPQSTIPVETNHQASSAVLPPRTVCEDLITLYFRYIHDTTQWIFHKPSLLEDFALRRLPDGILFAIIALAARFSNHSFFTNIDPRRRGLPYALKAAALLDLRNVSVESIQLCLTLGATFSNEGEALSEGVYYSTACRMATLLKLDQKIYTSVVEAELNTRILWSLKMSDVWSSTGNRVPRMLPPVPARYPMNETRFQSLRRGSADDSVEVGLGNAITDDGLSMLTNIIQLNGVLERVADYITTSIDPDAINLMNDNIDDLAAQLDSWYEHLHPRLKDTSENLSYHAQEGEAHVFLSLYFGYYHYDQLLHYQFLHEDAYSAASATTPRAQRCKRCAAALCDMLYKAYDTPGAEVYYAMVGHVLVIASTVQIHTVMFSSEEAEIEAAKYRLRRNYQILTELLCFWPTLDVSMARLQTFHSACLSMKESTFRMDQWMRRFLFEFAVPVEERQPEPFDTSNFVWPLMSPLQKFSPMSGSDAFDEALPMSSVDQFPTPPVQ